MTEWASRVGRLSAEEEVELLNSEYSRAVKASRVNDTPTWVPAIDFVDCCIIDAVKQGARRWNEIAEQVRDDESDPVIRNRLSRLKLCGVLLHSRNMGYTLGPMADAARAKFKASPA